MRESSLRVVAFCTPITMRTEKWSLRFAPTPGRSRTTGTPSDCSNAAGPTPESCSSFGVFNAPAQTITSRRAVTVRSVASEVPFAYRTPTARWPSNTMRVARAFVRTFRFARLRAGHR